MSNKTSNSVSSLKVLSFDLDNALYDNLPVITKAEADSTAYLHQQFQLQNRLFDFDQFMEIRKVLLSSGDIRYEDLSFLRLTALKRICENLANAEEIASHAFEVFINARSLATISPPIFQMLEFLSTKYILVSVTNGNCDASQLSICQFLSQNYSASHGYRAKPHPQMLLKVAQDFEVEPQKILHIGDSIEKDGGAAKAAGTKFYHFDPFKETEDIQLNCHQLIQCLS